MKRVLITGSNGFIGQKLNKFLQSKHPPIEIINSYRHYQLADQKHIEIGDINAHTNWQPALDNIDCIIHLAARVHIMKEDSDKAKQLFDQINTKGTLNLARQAIAAGVKRFIYISTIKVNGEKTFDKPFTADDHPNPQDDYARSKLNAEQGLLKLAKENNLEVVIIRPPLVIGQKAKGNIQRLQQLIKLKLPLPLAKINNHRSMVSAENLCDFIYSCMTHSKASGEIFLIKDRDLSTSELILYLAKQMKHSVKLFYLPVFLTKWLLIVVGKKSMSERLFNSLQLDISKNKQLLNWEPK